MEASVGCSEDRAADPGVGGPPGAGESPEEAFDRAWIDVEAITAVAVSHLHADHAGEIAPGVRAISTPGHTPGHQSLMVDIDDAQAGGGFIFAFDAGRGTGLPADPGHDPQVWPALTRELASRFS